MCVYSAVTQLNYKKILSFASGFREAWRNTAALSQDVQLKATKGTKSYGGKESKGTKADWLTMSMTGSLNYAVVTAVCQLSVLLRKHKLIV